MVRRNKFILGRGSGAVKGILVQCTTIPEPHCRNWAICNKMKHLNPVRRRVRELRT
jgi:hypothetical protein